MPIDSSAVAQSIATADHHLENLFVLCGILARQIEATRRDLRQIRSDADSFQSEPDKGHAAASELGADMLA
jgi:hypothetical protein